jgi:hypothetical protein
VLYWYKSTITDAEGAASGAIYSRKLRALLDGTKVQILTTGLNINI